MLRHQSGPATPTAEARRVEMIMVRLHEGGRHYTFGVLLGQVRTLLRRFALTLRAGEQQGPRRPVAEALHDDAWLPVYDLAQCLGLLAPWKQGVHTGVRNYLLVVGGHPPLALAVDEVAEIGSCPLNAILPLPAWLRRQLVPPPLVWGGLDPGTLIVTRAALDESSVALAGRPVYGPDLLLLLDCFALKNENIMKRDARLGDEGS